MMELLAQNLAPVMFTVMIIFLLSGYPVAFCLSACGLLFFFIGLELAPVSGGVITLQSELLMALPDRVFQVMGNETLLAIPFFTFMGLILERSGMAEDLLDTIGQLFGTLRGGIAYAVVFVGVLLAATTGVVAAAVISMGLISLPIMLRYGYDRRLATGVITASGTLAQIIPPSLVLIVLADQLGRPVGDMYAGALIPGLLLACSYAFYVWMISLFRPAAAPGLPPESLTCREMDGSRGAWQVLVLYAYSTVVGYGLVRAAAASSSSMDLAVLALSVSTLVSASAVLLLHLQRTARGAVLSLVAIVPVLLWAVASDAPDSRLPVVVGGVLTAGIAYALVALLLERTIQVRLVSVLTYRAVYAMTPPLLLIFLVLGTIFVGLATPTEGGAMGAAGVLLLAIFKRFAEGNSERFNLAMVSHAVHATAKLSCFVIFILIGARIFSLPLYGVNGHVWLEHLFTSLPGGTTGFLLFVAALMFVLAFFLDFFELAFILVPLLAPAAVALKIDLVWLGVLIAMIVQTSFLHPPFGFALFYLRSVAPEQPYADKVTGRLTPGVETRDIYWGAIPFIGLQMLVACAIVFAPGLVTHYGKAETKLDSGEVDRQLDQLNVPLPDAAGPLGDLK
jgi:tripartite ATP-independent transporter DctM subunit